MAVLMVIIVIDILVIAGVMYLVSKEKVSDERAVHPFVLQDSAVSNGAEQDTKARDWAVETSQDHEATPEVSTTEDAAPSADSSTTAD